jgi:hypothetical protein
LSSESWRHLHGRARVLDLDGFFSFVDWQKGNYHILARFFVDLHGGIKIKDAQSKRHDEIYVDEIAVDSYRGSESKLTRELLV